jgi:putative transposase
MKNPDCGEVWHGEEEVKRSRDDWCVETARSGPDGGRDRAGVGGSKHTIYAWKAKNGGMSVGEAQRLRQLEDKNGRLKKLVADLSLDKEMLKAVIERNGWSS